MGSGHAVRNMTNGNRVEELESEVAELKATVKGLTEELVEANDRIRQLEAAVGDEEGTDARDDVELLEDERLTSFVDVDDAEDADEETDPTGDVAASDADAGETDADRDKGDEDDEGDEGELDDIIVA